MLCYSNYIVNVSCESSFLGCSYFVIWRYFLDESTTTISCKNPQKDICFQTASANIKPIDRSSGYWPLSNSAVQFFFPIKYDIMLWCVYVVCIFNELFLGRCVSRFSDQKYTSTCRHGPGVVLGHRRLACYCLPDLRGNHRLLWAYIYICLSVSPRVYLPACVSGDLSAWLAIYLIACLRACLPVCLPACVSIYLWTTGRLSVCLSVCFSPSIDPSTQPPICLSISFHPPTQLSMCLSGCESVYA